MEMMINVVEAASELAIAQIYGEAYQGCVSTIPSPQEVNREEIEEMVESILFKDIGAEVLEYKPEWQDKFNEFYDYFFEMISNCAVLTKEKTVEIDDKN
ncbi:MAG TPA: hypothetical protein PLG47_00040 [Candidatus Dojkabacteria bacterium]|nr:hypothetical protein [Candidatus Dojkabacteria bacterium]